MMKMFEEMFGKKLPIIGVVHLQPLPGAPRYEGMAMKEISRIAVEEATIMVENGIDGLIVENFRDMMFKKRVGPETVAAMTYIAFEVASRLSVPIGLCVLQSDAISALAIAKAVGGKFIRVPYYTETYIVDAGTMESVEYFPKLCDAVIVGTSLKKDGKTEGPIDPERVRQFSKSMEKCRKELDR